MAKSKTGTFGNSKKNIKKDKPLKCRCGYHLREENFSTVRRKYFCLGCSQDISEQEVQDILWGVAPNIKS